MGLDRIVALTLGMESIRDIVAFPKTTAASDLMCEAPSTVDDHQMKDLFIQHDGLPPAKEDEAKS